jgi:cytochrome c553
MKLITLLIPAFVVIAIIVYEASATKNQALIDRGSYVVNRVSLCIDCHNERHPNGRTNEKRVLSGAPITFKPITPKSHWATYAPNLTPDGVLKDWTDQQLVKFLMTGIMAEGGYADIPMPQYRLDEADAKAVTAYLRNLPAIKTQEPTDHHH